MPSHTDVCKYVHIFTLTPNILRRNSCARRYWIDLRLVHPFCAPEDRLRNSECIARKEMILGNYQEGILFPKPYSLKLNPKIPTPQRSNKEVIELLLDGFGCALLG